MIGVFARRRDRLVSDKYDCHARFEPHKLRNLTNASISGPVQKEKKHVAYCMRAGRVHARDPARKYVHVWRGPPANSGRVIGGVLVSGAAVLATTIKCALYESFALILEPLTPSLPSFRWSGAIRRAPLVCLIRSMRERVAVCRGSNMSQIPVGFAETPGTARKL